MLLVVVGVVVDVELLPFEVLEPGSSMQAPSEQIRLPRQSSSREHPAVASSSPHPEMHKMIAMDVAKRLASSWSLLWGELCMRCPVKVSFGSLVAGL